MVQITIIRIKIVKHIDVTNNGETKTFILIAIRWFCRRSLILIRPYDDHETNDENQLTPLVVQPLKVTQKNMVE